MQPNGPNPTPSCWYSSCMHIQTQRGCKMEKSALVVVATPSPINPLRTTLGLSVIHSMPDAQCPVCFLQLWYNCFFSSCKVQLKLNNLSHLFCKSTNSCNLMGLIQLRPVGTHRACTYRLKRDAKWKKVHLLLLQHLALLTF